jgi:hypothetical protein
MKLKTVVLLVGVCGLIFGLQGCGDKKDAKGSGSSTESATTHPSPPSNSKATTTPKVNAGAKKSDSSTEIATPQPSSTPGSAKTKKPTADEMKNLQEQGQKLLDGLDAYSKSSEAVAWVKKIPTNSPMLSCISKIDGKVCMNFSNNACKTKQIEELVQFANEHFGAMPPCSVKEDSQAYAKKMTFKWIFDDGGAKCLKKTKIPSGSHEIYPLPYCMNYASPQCKKADAIKLLKQMFENLGDKAVPPPCQGDENDLLNYKYTQEAYYNK